MNWDKLLAALKKNKATESPSITNHPDWPKLKDQALPQSVSFYYENKAGDESYFENLAVIKLDLKRLLLVAEGRQGDPLRFDLKKVSHCKNAQTGEKVQDLIFELIRLWQDTYSSPSLANDHAQ